MTVAAVFAIIDLVGVGLEYAERIARIAGLSESQIAEVRLEVNARRKAAMDRLDKQQ